MKVQHQFDWFGLFLLRWPPSLDFGVSGVLRTLSACTDDMEPPNAEMLDRIDRSDMIDMFANGDDDDSGSFREEGPWYWSVGWFHPDCPSDW